MSYIKSLPIAGISNYSAYPLKYSERIAIDDAVGGGGAVLVRISGDPYLANLGMIPQSTTHFGGTLLFFFSAW